MAVRPVSCAPRLPGKFHAQVTGQRHVHRHHALSRRSSTFPPVRSRAGAAEPRNPAGSRTPATENHSGGDPDRNTCRLGAVGHAPLRDRTPRDVDRNTQRSPDTYHLKSPRRLPIKHAQSSLPVTTTIAIQTKWHGRDRASGTSSTSSSRKAASAKAPAASRRANGPAPRTGLGPTCACGIRFMSYCASSMPWAPCGGARCIRRCARRRSSRRSASRSGSCTSASSAITCTCWSKPRASLRSPVGCKDS